MRLWKKISLAFLALLSVLAFGAVVLGWLLSVSISEDNRLRVSQSPQYRDGKFVNIEPEAGFQFTWNKIADQFSGDENRTPTGVIPVVPIKTELLESPPKAGLRLAWLGHATVLVEIDGKRILTDPVFAQRVSPFSFAGPERFHPTPISLDKLSNIDAVVISHNHYDHLDETTIRHLAQQGTRFYVPLGNKSELQKWGVPEAQIEEMDWWQEVELDGLKFVATPARHYSSRGAFDYQETLWASWSIIGPVHRVFVSGDTGYSATFSEIGQRFGPFDATIIKIGAYGPGAYWHDIHMTPEEAIQVHKDVRGAIMLPVHWGTFNLALHAWDEPIIRTVKAAKAENVTLVTPRVGEFVQANEVFQSTTWWREVDQNSD